MVARPIPVSRTSPRDKNRPQYLLEVALECGEIADLGVMGRHRTFLITGPELIRHVFEQNATNYSKKTAPSSRSSRLLLGDGLLASEGDTNRARRRMMAGAFRRESLIAFHRTMALVVSELVAAWRSRGQAFEVDVADAMRDLSQQIVVRTMLGGEYIETTRRACAAWKTLSDYVGRSFLARFPVPLFIPTPDNRRYLKALADLDASVFEMIESCRQGRKSGMLLSTLVAALDRDEITLQAVRDEITNMFLAGQESVSACLTWTWYLLARAPEIAKAVEEERDALAVETPSYDQLGDLPYLGRVIEESLRLYPPGWLVDRLALEDDNVGGYLIPAGSMVLVSQYVSHRLPDHWERPNDFNPDRFSDATPVSPYVYFPWGIGRHLCYGKSFAVVELKLIIAMLVRHFRLSLPSGAGDVEAVPSIAFRPRHGLPMAVIAKEPGIR